MLYNHIHADNNVVSVKCITGMIVTEISIALQNEFEIETHQTEA